MLAKHSSQYITLHLQNTSQYIEELCPQERSHGLKMSDSVWRCPNVSDHVWPCLTWLAQPSTLILCRRHHWWSRTFCCPIASDICINSTGVDTSRETLHSQCQGESVTCDPKLARLVFWCILTSYAVIATLTNKNAEKKHILSSSDPHPEPLVWHSFWHTTWKILEVYMASLFWHSIWQ